MIQFFDAYYFPYPTVCPFCQKAFNLRHQLNKHLLTHSDVKPFKVRLQIGTKKYPGLTQQLLELCSASIVITRTLESIGSRSMSKRPTRVGAQRKTWNSSEELQRLLSLYTTCLESEMPHIISTYFRLYWKYTKNRRSFVKNKNSDWEQRLKIG